MIRISRLAATSVALFMLAGPAFAQTPAERRATSLSPATSPSAPA